MGGDLDINFSCKLFKNKMIKSEIIADSVNIKDNRLTTYILEYPRFIHAEVMTHRMFSKNAASSRAIPIEKMIQQVIDNPAMPVFWGKNQSGMQANEELDDIKREEAVLENIDYDLEEFLLGSIDGPDKTYYSYKLTNREYAEILWLEARDKAISYVRQLEKLGLHKQISNRLLEPWFNIRIILSGTEFENFFALRAHKDAQPELQNLAYLMLEQYNNSKPKELKPGEWHIPFGDKIDKNRIIEYLEKVHGFADTGDIERCYMKIAVARCARVSYFNYEGKDDYEADIKLCDRLFGNIPRHLSPTEHIAKSMDSSDYIGNFRGFKQYRKFFEDENLKDERVKK